MTTNEYPLAKQGVYRTIQGEGALMGLPIIFIRLGGCSVGCQGCDTDYRVVEMVTLEEIKDRASRLTYGGLEWVWLTGGEPTDHDIKPIIDSMHTLGLKLALATAGTRTVQRGHIWGGVDFLSVSPHSADVDSWVQRSGDQINIVPGLNGLRLAEISSSVDECQGNFTHRYITPLSDREGKPVNLQQCIEWVNLRRGWKLGIQSHRVWGLP